MDKIDLTQEQQISTLPSEGVENYLKPGELAERKRLTLETQLQKDLRKIERKKAMDKE